MITQNVFLTFADTAGNVQGIDVNDSDNTSPIYFELETQDLEFGNRAHLKKIANLIAVVTQNGQSSVLDVKSNDGDYKTAISQIDRDVKIGTNVNTEGNYFRLRWSGNTSLYTSGSTPILTGSPLLEAIYIEDITGLGITHG